MSDPCVHFESVSFRYSAVDVLHQVNLSLAPGQVFALLGPNGAGKSTIQKLIRGSLKPSSGRLTVLGCQPWLGDSHWRARIASVTDQPALPPRLSVRESLRFWAGLYGVPAQRVGEVVEKVGLTPLQGRFSPTLSRGQQQKVAWARALLVGAELLLLDEPTNGLDLDSKEEVHSLVRLYREEGHTIVLTTHDMREAQVLADYVGIVDEGRILDQGTPDDLCQRHLGQGLQEVPEQPTLEKVYRILAGRSLYSASERQASQCRPVV